MTASINLRLISKKLITSLSSNDLLSTLLSRYNVEQMSNMADTIVSVSFIELKSDPSLKSVLIPSHLRDKPFCEGMSTSTTSIPSDQKSSHSIPYAGDAIQSTDSSNSVPHPIEDESAATSSVVTASSSKI